MLSAPGQLVTNKCKNIPRKNNSQHHQQQLLTEQQQLFNKHKKETQHHPNNYQYYFQQYYHQRQQHQEKYQHRGRTKLLLLSSRTSTSSTASLLPSLSPSKSAASLATFQRASTAMGSTTTMKRGFGGGSSISGKKQNWGNRKRAGMSFLIVIAFFAIFGLIILTEVFMIDERSHGGVVMLRHGSSSGGNSYGGSRLGDSLPDYDNVKDDYDLLDEGLFGENKLGFVQFHDNKLKIQEAGNGGNVVGRLAGVLLSSNGAQVQSGGGDNYVNNRLIIDGLSGANGGLGSALSLIPWGKMLSAKDEKTLPPFPIGMQAIDGAWQVVNGTRFKFFVYSAYYDRRDGARLVRIIGATKTRGPERVWCRFWHRNRNTSSAASERSRYSSATVMARVKVIRENWNLKYSACFILCPVRSADLQMPQFVSVVARLRTPPGNLLLLRNTDSDVELSGRFRNASLPMQASAAAASDSGGPGGANGGTITHRAAALLQQALIPDKIAVCVKPFHFNYDQALYLMEYLELYTLLGVSHFTFYNHTIGPQATCVLQHYANGDIPGNLTAQDDELIGMGAELPDTDGAIAGGSTGTPHINTAPVNTATSGTRLKTKQPTRRQQYYKPTVQILPWNLRMRSQKEIRTEGLFAALNDCVYRNMYRYKYLALVDLDEFIVPRQTDSLNELINSLNRRFRNGNAGAYSFQNGFFYLQFPDDTLAYQPPQNIPEQTRVRAALVTQRKTKRRFKLHPQKQRSKYICKPEAVIEAGNHFVWEFAPGKGSLNVAPSEAILQHYRVCEFGGNDCVKAPAITDRTATKYVNRLVQRVSSVYAYLKTTCKLNDLPELPKLFETELKIDVPNLKFDQKKQNTATSKLLSPLKQQSQSPVSQLSHSDRVKSKMNETQTHSVALTTISKQLSEGNTVHIIHNNSTAKKLSTIPHQNSINGNSGMSIRPQFIANQGNNISRKKRKFVVFEEDNDGRTMARVEYE